jgi:hypothetical protein
MFPCLPTRGNIVEETKFASREEKCFLANSEKFDVSLCFLLMFPSVCPLLETWRNIGRKQCFRNNVSYSSLPRALPFLVIIDFRYGKLVKTMFKIYQKNTINVLFKT